MKVTDGAKVFIKNRQHGKYLFCLRDDNPNIPSPNCWSLFGGGIEVGETPLEALKREVAEEINIDIFDIKLLGSQDVVLHVKKESFTVRANVFMAYTDAELGGIEFYEGQRVGYFTLKEIKQMENVTNTMSVFIKRYRKFLI